MEENLNLPGQQQDIFEAHEEYIDASQGSRFLNWLVDNLFMQFVLSFATGYIVGFILSIVAPEFMLSLAYEEETSGKVLLLSFVIGYFNYFVYYTICEAAFKGYTLGKLLTGTRAVRNDGQALTFKDAILRSLSRMVPFEVFSALGNPSNPWHDTWTNTRVIKVR